MDDLNRDVTDAVLRAARAEKMLVQHLTDLALLQARLYDVLPENSLERAIVARDLTETRRKRAALA